MKVRFAPSPTGYLHVGGARTALFNWLYARHHGGTFLLRIEDTDAERSDPAMTEQILDAMRWLGLNWDEGPYFQSERRPRYRELVDRLVAEGKAYWSDRPPSAKTVKGAALQRNQQEQDESDESESSPEKEEVVVGKAVWFKMPAGETSFEDGVRGPVTFQNDEIGDFVILKSDGYPTYHMAVSVDDAEMGVTHVIRGDDHLSNTPKQIQLFRALGYEPPKYSHVPLILGTDKKRLSKRHGATSVQQFREDGILPEALFNFLALLGWSPGDDRELLSRDEIIRLFSVERIGKKGAVFDYDKLGWMNGQYITAMDPKSTYDKIEPQIKSLGGPLTDLPNESTLRLVELLKEKVRRLDEIVPFGPYAFTDQFEIEPESAAKHWKGEDLLARLELAREFTATFAPFTAAELEAGLKALAESKGFSFGKMIHPLRVAVTGRAVTPNLFEIMELIGRERSLKRVQRALELLSTSK